jgi:hypothetical protein
MPEEFWVTVASVAVSAGIGSYLTSRLLETGRIAAMRACFQDVLEQAEGRAQAEERGKRLATHEDIENVLIAAPLKPRTPRERPTLLVSNSAISRDRSN